MNVAIIPCFDRPEFLAITLEQITKAKRAQEFVYLFSLDYGYDRTCQEVIDRFPFEKVIVKRKGTNYRLGKQSSNLLNAYAEACYLAESDENKLIALIEDDILINPDFFKWHMAVHEKEPNAFCSIGSENHNTRFNTEDDDSLYYRAADTDYQSWGVMWNASVLKKYILPHANSAYYRDPINYILRLWNYEWIGKHFAEQDGLIRRIRYEQREHPVLFPHKARCFHAGFYSYHRNIFKRFRGPLQQRIETIKAIISDPETYRKYCESPDFYNDSRAIDLTHEFNYKALKFKQPN